jgi:3-deoxy-D-manno-octulosonate 8-phosphate phosphatase (KDO 8-P phosphatase)
MTSYKEKLNNITTFIFDVDGVFTDGAVLLYNDDVVRTFNSKDGYVVQYASKLGYKIFAITGGHSKDVEARLLGLGFKEVHMRSTRKIDVYNDIKKRHSLVDAEIMYMGDDIPDYPVLKEVGLSCCPQDAVSDIKEIVDYQSPVDGGKGCVRDIIEQTLRVQSKWMLPEAFEW